MPPIYRKNESNRQMDQFEQHITEGQVYYPGSTGAKAIKLTTGVVPKYRAGVMDSNWDDKDTKNEFQENFDPDDSNDVLAENGDFLVLEAGGRILLEQIII